MPTMLCPHCGTKLKFEGIATVCTSCGRVVRVTAPPNPPHKMAGPPLPAKTRAVRLSDIEEVHPAAEEVFAPEVRESTAHNDKLIWQLSIGAGAVLLLFLLIGIFWPSSKKPPASPAPVVIAPPPPVVVAPPPPVDTPTVITTPATAPAPPPAWALLKPILPPTRPDATLTDQRVGESIQNGVNFLINHIADGKITDPNWDPPGLDTLCVYALLHAGDAISDPRLGTANPLMQQMMKQMRELEMTAGCGTYGHSIRASALAMHDRAEDRSTLRRDLDWLVAASSAGHYGYTMPPKTTKPEDAPWDNSNSQYGLLGVWAASQAGMFTNDDYWKNIESHWLIDQRIDGGWGYSAREQSTLTMTCAGVTSLCVASEQRGMLLGNNGADNSERVAKSLQKAVDWMGTGDRLINLPQFPGYALYGIERAALATGYKWFGKHNWYWELAAMQIEQQSKTDGSWTGTGGPFIETAFRILFLSRGRQPLLINKLRFDGHWNNRPRDASKLVEFAAMQLEQPFAWGVADLTQDWNDWIDCPVLFITTDEPPTWTDEQYQKLRSFVEAGGMIFLNNESSSPAIDAFANELAKNTFPDAKLAPLPTNHPVYSTVFPLKSRPPLKAVSNGERLLLLYSPVDITKTWVTRKSRTTNDESELGLNIFVYSAGLEGFRRRLNTPFIAEPDFHPLGMIPIQEVMYPGHWNPEPGAWVRFPRWFQNQTSLGLAIQPTEMADLKYSESPMALMTGNTAVDFDALDVHGLHDFVNDGGILLIDSAGGSPEFIRSVRDQLLPKLFPEAQPIALSVGDPILAGTGDCMDLLPKPRLRRFAGEQLKGSSPALDLITVGKGAVIISDLDITTGLLNTGTWGINGYTTTYCQSLLKNAILWSLARYHP